MRESAQRAFGRAQNWHSLGAKRRHEFRGHRELVAQQSHHHRFATGAQHRQQRIDLGHRILERARDHRQAEAANTGVGEQRLGGARPQRHVAQHLRGNVERIVERGKSRQHRLQLVDCRGRKARHVEDKLVAEIQREAFDGARIGNDAGPFHRRLAARKQLGDVDQLIDGLDHIDCGVAEKCRCGRIVAGERPGV